MPPALLDGHEVIALSTGGITMQKLVISSLTGLALLGACGGNDSRSDDALKNDLALAAQAQPYQAQQFVSPNEQGFGANGSAPQYNAAGRTAPRASAPVYRAPTRRTTSRASQSRSSGTYTPSAPQEPI